MDQTMTNFTAISFITICVLILMIYSIATMILKQHRFYKLASKFRGPPCWPIIGNAHLFISNIKDSIKTIDKLIELYPPPFRVWMANRLIIAVTDPEQIKIICLSPKTIDKGEFHNFIQPWLGTGLFTASAAKWLVHRKLIAPAFHLEVLQSFVEVFAVQATKMVQDMEQKLDGSAFRVCEYLMQYALMTVCETTMGVSLEVEMNNNIHNYTDAVKKVMSSIVERIASPWLYSNVIFSRSQLGRDQQKHIKLLHDFADNVIQRKKKTLLERGSQAADPADDEDDERGPIPQRKAFLDHLFQCNESKALSDEELREEVCTIMVAGTDTTAAVSSFVMLMLASYPEVQERVYEELCTIHGNHDGEDLNISMKSLNRLTYLDRVIKETMRLFPLGPYLFRRATDDLDIGGHILPKGSQVLLGILNVHRNEKYWPDPMKFDPDRFLPEAVAKRHPYSYLPFSGGARNCIGSKYAMLSMKTLLATILCKYALKNDNFVPVEDIRLKIAFILKTTDPIKLRLERRVAAVRND